MDGTKVCPKCGSKTLMAVVRRGGIVESKGIDENGNPIFELVRENTNKFDLEIIGCASCKTKLTTADLIGGVVCKHCGKMVAPDDLDESGNCSTCSMLIKNPELENASQEDLLRLLAQAYRGMNPLSTSIDKKIEMGEAMETEAAQANSPAPQTHTAADDILSGNVPQDVQEKKTRRRAVRKKSSDSTTGAEESSENLVQNGQEATQDAPEEKPEEVPAIETNVAEEALAGAQEAPFPEVPQEYQAPTIPGGEGEPEPAPQPEPQSTGGFQMFDAEEDEF